MLLEINKANNESEFENRVVWFKAMMIQEYINKLDVSQETKLKVKKEVIKKLGEL